MPKGEIIDTNQIPDLSIILMSRHFSGNRSHMPWNFASVKITKHFVIVQSAASDYINSECFFIKLVQEGTNNVFGK